MSGTLIEIECEKCGKTYMGEIDTNTGEFYGGCPHCKDEADQE